MSEGPIGEFWRRYPTDQRLHESKAGAFFEVPCHEHSFGHVRFLWAGDTPGPDGRVGWHEIARSPIRGNDGKVIGWHDEIDHIVRGNGPGCERWVPAGWRHEFKLLSATGYHLCFFHNREPDVASDEAKITEICKLTPGIDPETVRAVLDASKRVTDISAIYNGWGRAFE